MRRTATLLGVTLLAALTGIGVPDASAACDRCGEARALYEKGQAKDAIQILKKAVKSDKDSAEANGLLALCYYAAEKPKDAANAVPQFLRSSPTPAQFGEVRAAAVKAAQPLPANVHFARMDGIEKPLLLLFSHANYPQDAREFGVEADVVLDAVIGADGVATDIEIRRIGDWSMNQIVGFDEAAISALKRWRFFPALREGAPVPVKVTVVGIFRMVD
jgi:TonB family protein